MPKQPFSDLVGGQHGTCDQGGCHNPADHLQDGLPCCGECLKPPERFTIQNPPPKPAAESLFEPKGKAKQRVLLAGLNCLPGQEDLFPDMTCT